MSTQLEQIAAKAKADRTFGNTALGIPTVEDRLVQRAVARILEAVFEADSLDCSYGFRPGRSAHQALGALRGTLVTKRVRHVYEADIRGYFNQINHQRLKRMVAHRIADGALLRLIGKWLRAGVMQDGVIVRLGWNTARRSAQPDPGQCVSAFCARPMV